jgi:predicted ArsR family transcriptional regulator
MITTPASAISDVTTAMALQHWFGLERGSSRVLLALYQQRTAPLTAADLAKATGCTAHAMRSHHIPQIREAMEMPDSEAVDFEAGGYRLTETGRAQCLEAIRQMGEELVAEAAAAGGG